MRDLELDSKAQEILAVVGKMLKITLAASDILPESHPTAR
jgi:hypothetical protein